MGILYLADMVNCRKSLSHIDELPFGWKKKKIQIKNPHHVSGGVTTGKCE